MEQLEVATKIGKWVLAIEASAGHSNEVFKQTLNDAKLRLEESRRKKDEHSAALDRIGGAGYVIGFEFGKWIQSISNPDEDKDKSGDQNASS